MSKDIIIKNCEKCLQPFECNSINIEQCFCFQLKISKETAQFLSENYEDCICNNCLVEVSNKM